MRDWVARHQARMARVRLHLVPLEESGLFPGPDPLPLQGHDVRALARLAVSLRRYDGCILPVTPSTVAWARMALAQAGPALTTPVLLLMDDMKAPAIEDLLGLGVADFIAQPACLESVRVRLGRMARPSAWRHPAGAGLQEPAASYPGSDGAEAHGQARPRVLAAFVDPTLAGMRHRRDMPDMRGMRGMREMGDARDNRDAARDSRDMRRLPAQESFRVAKSLVVDGFERDYIRHALSRHGGNVAQAARACAKHRRAFWALMRKHGIEAAPYRQAALARRMGD
ncbi:helix-turn-helix domain-containing protein [Achromobacter marplatensis]